VCSLTAKTSCSDSNPPDSTTYPTIQYYVVAYDSSASTKSADATVTQTGNSPPGPPGSLTASFVDGLPTLTWTTATDSDGSIQFYRIYRDGTALSDRYAFTGTPVLTYTDRDDSGGHSYWVTAVDNKFAESTPVGPVTP
jgi:hypothetical protein